MNFVNKLDTILITIGTIFGIAEIESLLGVLILGFQIVLILWKIGYKIYSDIKNDNYSEVEETLKNGLTELEKIKGSGNNDNNTDK